MPPRHQLRCLGEPQLLTLGDRPVRLRTRKHLALLCFLAVERRPFQRDLLAEFFWPRARASHARHSLVVAMSEVRQRLGRDCFEVKADRIRLKDGQLLVDVDRLLQGDILGDETGHGPLELDGFLEDFELEDTPSFNHWRDRVRARFLPHIRDALVILIDRCRRTGAFRAMEPLGDRLHKLDELSEEAARARMEARAFAGDRLGALRIFEHWKAELAGQLGAAPSALVEGIAARLRRGWERPGEPAVPPVRTEQWKDRPFIGRAREYRALYEAWEGMRRGEVCHRLLMADSGIGKSALLDRLMTAAGLEGATVARVQCHEFDRELPFAAISGLIAQLVEKPGAAATEPELLAELARLVPVVRRRFPNLPPVLEMLGEAARLRFTDAVHALVAAVGAEHPVILVVDDVHCADDVSLAVLHLVMRRAQGEPLLVLFAARPGELGHSPQAARLRDQGESLGVRVLPVPPLTEEECDAVLAALLEGKKAPSVTARRALVRAAAGYPMVLELLLRDWEHTGAHALALAIDAMTSEAEARGGMDEAYRLLLERLITTLDPETRNVLGMAALLGSRLNDPGMYALADLTVGQTLTGLTRLQEERILRESPRGIEFVNELIRGHAYMSVVRPLRGLLHGRVADALIAQAHKGADDLDLEIAWHCVRSNRSEEAIPYLLRGARRGISAGAVHEAERRLGTAMSWLAGDPRRQAALLLSELFLEQARWEEAREALLLHDEAAGSDEGWILEQSARARTTHRSERDWREIAGELEVRILRPIDAHAFVNATRLSVFLSSRLKERAFAERFLELTEGRHPDGWTVYHDLALRTARLQLLYHLGQRHSIDEELSSIAESAKPLDRPNVLSFTLLKGLGACAVRLGDYERALGFISDALTIAKRLDNPEAIANAHAHLAMCHCRLGNLHAQVLHAEHALSKAVSDPLKARLLASYHGALGHALTGHPRVAENMIEQIQAEIDGSFPAWAQQATALYAADVLFALEREKPARELGWQAFERHGFRTTSPDLAGAMTRTLSRSLELPERRDRATSEIRKLYECRDRLDALDYVEVTAAFAIACADPMTDMDRLRRELAAASARLPAATCDLIKRLGIPLPG